jgi:hypothetical protein
MGGGLREAEEERFRSLRTALEAQRVVLRVERDEDTIANVLYNTNVPNGIYCSV